MTKKYVGLSLSGCISDLIKGEKYLSDVAFIIAGTRADSDALFCYLIQERYAELMYWENDPLMAMRLAFKLYAAGRIVQPRVTGGVTPNPGSGCWLEWQPSASTMVEPLCESCRKRFAVASRPCPHEAEVSCGRCDECRRECAESTFPLCDRNNMAFRLRR